MWAIKNRLVSTVTSLKMLENQKEDKHLDQGNKEGIATDRKSKNLLQG